MKTSLKLAIAAAAIGAVSFAAPASAKIVCNDKGDCWHVHDAYTYPPEAGIVVHEDNWRWEDADHDKYRWHEHEGRGYWRNGVWITF